VDQITLLEQRVMVAVMRLRPKAYGVAIQELINDDTGRAYSYAAIYAALDRLEQRGLVTSKAGEPTPERGGRRKFYFELTAPGQKTLQAALGGFDTLRRGIRLAEVPT
jgi:PadR family transcriptional regulator, regulatory protein PadR